MGFVLVVTTAHGWEEFENEVLVSAVGGNVLRDN